MIQALESENESLLGILPTIENFVGDTSLDGGAWKGLKAQLTGHQTIIRGLITANESMIADSETLAGAVGSENLDEDKLTREIERQKAIVTSNQALIESYQNAQKLLLNNPIGSGTANEGRMSYYSQLISDKRSVIKSSQKLIEKAEEKLEELYEIESSTSALYTESASLYASAGQGAEAIKKSWTGSGFSLPQGMPWQKNLDSHWDLSESNRTRELKRAGWTDEAIEAYNNYLAKKLEGLTGEERKKMLRKVHEDTYLVGSDVYEMMLDNAGLDERGKVNLLLKQMGATIDENNMLQLSGKFKFDPNMPPHDTFLEKFANWVKKAYPKGLLPSEYSTIGKEEIIKIHQFRMYIDRQNISYIRLNFEGKTDYEKLKAYGEKHGLDYSSGSSLHNRYLRPEDYNGQKNDKVKSKNGLSEFIIEVETGNFVSQWDVLTLAGGGSVFDENGNINPGKINSNPEDYPVHNPNSGKIVETESFNYDKKDDYILGIKVDDSHSKFDVDPAGSGKGLEHDVKIALKPGKQKPREDSWAPAEKNDYKEKYKSEKDYPNE